MNEIVTEKRCSVCHEVLPLSCFSPSKSSCKACRSKKSNDYNKKHREQHNQNNANYRRSHLETIRQLIKSWKKRNPNKQKEYYAKDPERSLSRNSLWRKNNPEKIKVYDSKRRASKKYAEGSYTADDWIALCEKYENRCLCCKQRKPLTADHVLPLAKGGSNDISNIQPLCKSCNSAKGTKYIDYR